MVPPLLQLSPQFHDDRPPAGRTRLCERAHSHGGWQSARQRSVADEAVRAAVDHATSGVPVIAWAWGLQGRRRRDPGPFPESGLSTRSETIPARPHKMSCGSIQMPHVVMYSGVVFL